MKHQMKKMTAVLLMIVCMAAIPLTAAAQEADPGGSADSGVTGDCSWTLDENGVLTISGNGEMADYELKLPHNPYQNTAPWGEDISAVVIEDGVTRIGTSAFGMCEQLTGITIPDSVTSIGASAFYSCKGLTDVVIPDKVTEIGNSAFDYCPDLKSVTIPASVTRIGSYAFDFCGNLKSVLIADIAAWCEIEFQNRYANPLSNGGDLYLNGEKISELTIPDGVTSISPWAFTGALTSCSCLTSVTISDGVTSIGMSAFEHCRNLTDFQIPDSVTHLGDCAFNDTAWYDEQPGGMVYAGDFAYNYKGTMPENTSVIIKDGTKKIADRAFYDCTDLVGVTIPDSVTNIADSAFERCDNVTLYGSADSYAAAFAAAHELPFVVIASGMVGDVNRDGNIDISDVTDIQKYLAELTAFSDEQLGLADANGDGSVNITDATHLQMYLAELDVVLGKQPEG